MASARVLEETQRLYAGLLKDKCQSLLASGQLERPSFRLIQEIAKLLMVECRILRDVFSQQDFEPLRSKDRRFRLAFLKRLLEFCAGQRQPVIGCVPERILAGQEPNKTLELLQCLARIARQRQQAAGHPSGAGGRPRTYTKAPAAGPQKSSLGAAPRARPLASHQLAGAALQQPADSGAGSPQPQEQRREEAGRAEELPDSGPAKAQPASGVQADALEAEPHEPARKRKLMDANALTCYVEGDISHWLEPLRQELRALRVGMLAAARSHKSIEERLRLHWLQS